MPEFCANLTFLFGEVPFLDRFEAAAKAGFKAVEFAFPYEHDVAELRARLTGNGLSCVLFNTAQGDLAAGDRGIAAVPGREGAFRNAILQALDYADGLADGQGRPLIHVMAGLVAEERSSDAAAVYAENLAWAAERAATAGVTLVIEPINRQDLPGYFLERQDRAAAIIKAVGSDALRLLFDAYHCQMTEGALDGPIGKALPLIAHMQIADAPGRHEPGTGGIDWNRLFAWIDSSGYQGFVGCEYKPVATTLAGLSWRERFGV